jgi:hypothetical protein
MWVGEEKRVNFREKKNENKKNSCKKILSNNARIEN